MFEDENFIIGNGVPYAIKTNVKPYSYYVKKKDFFCFRKPVDS